YTQSHRTTGVMRAHELVGGKYQAARKKRREEDEIENEQGGDSEAARNCHSEALSAEGTELISPSPRSLASPVLSECEGLGMTKVDFAQVDKRELRSG